MRAFHATRVFDGTRWHEDAALVVEEGRVARIARDVPGAERVAGWILPGLVDLQVNGGGGVLFNNDPSAQGLACIRAAHARLGTTGMMVTLITDTPEVVARAVEAAASSDVMGLHLEGPHFAMARKGTHDGALIRPMEEVDLRALEAAAGRVRLLCTLAPEVVGVEAIRRLVAAGAVVSLGHSDATDAEALAAAAAGARMVTHLFNAMSPLSHRAPGLVGAALDDERFCAGIIADGFHVEDAVLRIALRAAPERIFLVSDAMSTVGTDLPGFTLNGREILRQGGRLTLADGTLAGADIALIDAVRHVVGLGVGLEEAWGMGSSLPAAAMEDASRGGLREGQRADFVAVDEGLGLCGVWIGGVAV
ncbi:N-acetylglucosamine-6-phosphate deacetylase [Falsirhodobacter sp. 20TX0035]|nr:N-acetylglucosamine-6-phosphate deacetylase [Falsirhodobacter sp. 20TX0035]MDB6452881.1 N-acetylglucosamine-6-phosphate deacetylase [Falsirhodobacter sp. 20TX0035]